MRRTTGTTIVFGAVLGWGALAAMPASATVNLVNGQGATAPCVGFGPIGGPAAEKCGVLFEQAGFIREEQVGSSGVTVGVSGADDGVITKVEPGSPAARAGLAAGDVVVSIDGKPVKRTPGSVAAEKLFGTKGAKKTVTLRHGGAERTANLVLAAAPAPQGPKMTGFMATNKLLADWRGSVVPCSGIGPAGPAAIVYCTSHFKSYGFIAASDLGGAGVTLDQDKPDRAVVTRVDPGSPAAGAGVSVGDEIITVDGQPLTGSAGAVANERLFGKAGDSRKITYRRGGTQKTVELTLAKAAR